MTLESTSTFALFADALAQCRGQPVSSLLDSASGLALLFAETCEAKAASTAEDAGAAGTSSLLSKRIQGASGDPMNGFLELYEDDDADEAVAWRLEEQTWRLIHLLHAERAQRSGGRFGAASSSKTHLYQTPFAAVQDIIEGDAALSELNIVRDWLSGNLACNHPVEVRKGYWPFTKNKLRGERRIGSSAPNSAGGVGRIAAMGRGGMGKSALSSTIPKTVGVKSLDPDATTREASTLELEDAAYEKALNKTLFEYARGGQLDDAIDLARQTDRSWRAASLRGANLYWRPGLDDEMDGLTAPFGSRNRSLWKAVCRSLCSKPSMDEFEKALYGALSGDLKSVMTVSTTWDAQLWAHANARLEAAIDVHLNKSGNWWNQDASLSFGFGGEGKDLGAVQLTDLRVPGNGDEVQTDGGARKSTLPPTAVELRDVFVKLAQTEQNGIHVQANHPFRIVQRAVILSELPALLTHVESLLPSMRVTVSPQQYARLIRFLAHLILYLRLIKSDKMPSDVVCNSILKSYVDVLENVGEDDLVALYASSLEPESATESYAHYLKLMDANESLDAKRTALLRADTHDLDVAAVAVATVSMIFDEVFPSLMPSQTLPKAPLSQLSTSISASEERLVRAIDWLCIHESTHLDAIVHVNILMRLFLNSGRLTAARALLYDLPAEVVGKVAALEADGDGDLQATEFVHWRAFFDAIDRHLRYVEVWSRRPAEEGVSRTERMHWNKGLSRVVDDARVAILQVLQMEWLKLSPGQAADGVMDAHTERRLAELARIRQIFIPEFVFRLHSMLYETHAVLPETLAAAVQLPNLVAAETDKLYLDFISGEQNRLPEFLSLVRTTTLEAMQINNDPFYFAAA